MVKSKKKFNLVRLVGVLIIIYTIPFFFPNAYIAQIANLIGIYMLMAMSLNLLTGFTGQLSLGHAAFFGVGAYTSAIVSKSFGLPFLICLLIAVTVTTITGLLLAIPALKVRGTYLVLVTIAYGEIVRLLMINWVSLTNGPNGIYSISPVSIFGYKFNDLTKSYYLVITVAFLIYLYIKLLMESRAGRAFLSIRDDASAAELCGVDITMYKIKAFAISAAISGVAGSLYAHMYRYISPSSFSATQSQLFLCMILIGGMGTLPGPVIGAVVLTILPEMLRFMQNGRMLVYGILILLVVIRSPGGIAKYLSVLIGKIKKYDGDHRKRQHSVQGAGPRKDNGKC